MSTKKSETGWRVFILFIIIMYERKSYTQKKSCWTNLKKLE